MASMAIFFPPAAPVVLVMLIPGGVILVCLYRVSKPKTEREGAAQGASLTTGATQQQPKEMQRTTEATSGHAPDMDSHKTSSDTLSQPSPSPSTPRINAEKGQDSVENLQARVNELEERVRQLRERLAVGLAVDTSAAPQAEHNGKSAPASTPEGAEELSERALQQLLEALDEKLVKGTISQQLYQRLREKYLARLGRARAKREAAPQPVSSKPRSRR